jgi:uncharacterized protein (DUF1330 family)
VTVLVVANFDITDHDLYRQYRARVLETLQPYGGKILAVDSEPKHLDGDSRSEFVIAEFESAEVARRWYESPEYHSVLQLRLDSTEGWLRLVPLSG